MPLEERWCNTNFGYIIYHHSRGSWRRPDFRDMMWNDTTQKGDDVVQISELWSGITSKKRRSSLDLEGIRRCPQKISNAKYTSEIWEDVHRRWAIPWRLHFLQKRLEILFYSTTKHQLMVIIISKKVKQCQLLTVFIFYCINLWSSYWAMPCQPKGP